MKTTLLLTTIFLLALAVPAAAQTDRAPDPVDGASWTLPDALGYGGLGFGVGLAMAWGMESDDIGPPLGALVLVGATTAVGFVGGALIGRGAERAVERGRPVGAGHRVAVLGGTVMAGAILGSLAAVPLINSEGEGTPLGSDEQTVLMTTIAGGALGSLYAWRNAGELSRGTVDVAPVVTGRGAYGASLRVRF